MSLTADGKSALFLRSGGRSFVRDLFLYDIATGEERMLLTAAQLLDGRDEVLTPEERARRERLRAAEKGITSYGSSADGRLILVPLSGRLFVLDRVTEKVEELISEGPAAVDARFSPDGRSVAAVRDGDLWIFELGTKRERRLTQRESETVTFGLPEYIAQEEMHRYQGYWWSPDGSVLAVQRTDTAGLEEMFLADALHPEVAPKGSPYPRPGRANAETRLGLVAATGGAITWIKWDFERHPYLATVRWDRGAPLTLVVQDRAQTELVILTVDLSTGLTKPIHVERDADWLNLDQDMPRWLPNGDGFLWTSERSGEWQLELRAPDGSLLRTITPLGFGYAGYVGMEARLSRIWVRASADPVETHLWRVALDAPDAPPERMTTDRGQHAAVLGRGDVWVHTRHTLSGEWLTSLRRLDGTLLGDLRSVAETPPFYPSLEVRRVAASLDLATAVIRPRDFDARRRYPVIVSVYGGPHAQMVTASPFDYLLQQWLADHGFVVISIDGRGTPRRGRAFERAIRGSFVEVPLADQVAGLQSMLEAEPSLDRARVGIYGWSFGGYLAAMAAMLRPDVYRAAVAGAPVTDWLDYDTHYTERYLGQPEERPDAYEGSSVLARAHRLERPLLIIHGTSDDNVYFSHSMKLSDALFRAGRAHEILPLAGFTHMVPDPLVTRRLYERIAGFFIEHLS